MAMGTSTVMSTARQVDSSPSTQLYTTKSLTNYSFVRKRSPDVLPRIQCPTYQQGYPSDFFTKKNQVVQTMNVNPGELGLSSADTLEGPHSSKGPDIQSPYPQCDRCTPCPQECAQASCLIPEITSECTDQCLVVACDDPDHPDSECRVKNGNEPCDGSCVRGDECPECPGLEEILQCCTNYHSYFAEPKSYDGPTMPPWDNTLSDIFCGCEDNTRTLPPPARDPCIPEIYHTTPLPQPVDVLRGGGSDPSSCCTTPSPLLSASSYSPIGSTIHTPLQQPVSPHICIWGNCQLTFSTLAELVGHVNLQHLRGSGPGQSNFPLVGEPSFFPQSTLSCHWGDCAMYPSPSSIPSSSSGRADQAIDLLTTHLMQDHLGVNLPFPTTTAVSPAPHNRLVSPSTSQEATPAPSSSPPPDCHTCRWQACSQIFASSDELTAHIASMHVGSGKAHYDCFWEGCTRNGDNGFSSKQKISRHLQSHTGHRPFQCKICAQNFSEAATLQQHMRRHTQEKPYVCDHPGCGRAFAITGALTIHKRTHNGQRPFKCTYCNKAFSESSNLSKHLRTHTGARPYECPEEGCKKSFARPDQLARHMSVHRRKDSAVVAGSS